jgi:hypothetical protein
VRGVLENVAIGAGAQAFVDVFVGLVYGQHQHARVRIAPLDVHHGLDAVHARHRQVHQDQMGRQHPDGTNGIAPVVGLADDLEIGILR